MPKLTKRTIDAIEPQATEFFLWDEGIPGFGLRVMPSGRKSFVVQFRAGRRARRMSLGPSTVLTCDHADHGSAVQARDRVVGDLAPEAEGGFERSALNRIIAPPARKVRHLGTRTGATVPAAARDGGVSEIAYRDAVTDALLHRHSPGLHKLTEAAREFRGLNLLDMARHALERRGISRRGLSRMELATEALQKRAGPGYHSSADFPFILANVANKTLRSAYDSTPRTFTAWARQATITDFRPVQRTPSLPVHPTCCAYPRAANSLMAPWAKAAMSMLC